MQSAEQQHSQLVGDCLLALMAGILDMKDHDDGVVWDLPTVPVKGKRLKEGLLKVCNGRATGIAEAG